MLKIRAEINLECPLLRGTNIKCDDQVVWVDFRYENLAMFCFYCGKVGHYESGCVVRRLDANQSSLVENQYGEWLRAETGRSSLRQSKQLMQLKQGGLTASQSRTQAHREPRKQEKENKDLEISNDTVLGGSSQNDELIPRDMILVSSQNHNQEAG